ncbi:MAG: hypothetical protein WCI18_10415 [Pseudomonadota bacterium]
MLNLHSIKLDEIQNAQILARFQIALQIGLDGSEVNGPFVATMYKQIFPPTPLASSS